ncbi:hypothetical protein PT276_10425 [Orbaceae bacterium ESL0721]|nr:hypothetical protein [Orbaceae bacterium ESL0721]
MAIKPTEAQINQLAYNKVVNDHIINQNNLGTMGGGIDKGITAAASIATGIIWQYRWRACWRKCPIYSDCY